MWKILLSEFWGDLRGQKTRSLLTLFAVFWGALTVAQRATRLARQQADDQVEPAPAQPTAT